MSNYSRMPKKKCYGCIFEANFEHTMRNEKMMNKIKKKLKERKRTIICLN